MNFSNWINSKQQGLKKIFATVGGNKSCIGVDIGSQSIKIIELENKKGELVLKNYALVKTNEKIIKIGTQGVVEDKVSVILKQSFNKAKIKGKNINVAVPGFASLVIVFEVPSLMEGDIQQVIKREAPKYIPISLKDVVYDWQAIDEDNPVDKTKENLKEKTSGKKKVLVVAIMKDISAQYEKVVANAGLTIDSLEVDAFSLNRALTERRRGCYLIIDLGYQITNVVVVSNGNILINRTINVAGGKITSTLSKSLGINWQRAEQIKIERGFNNVDEELKKSTFLPVLKMITEETQKIIDNFKTEYPEKNIEQIILSGGTAKLAGVDKYFQTNLNIKTTIANPFEGIAYPDKISSTITNYQPIFSVAVGLARLGLDNK